MGDKENTDLWKFTEAIGKALDFHWAQIWNSVHLIQLHGIKIWIAYIDT